MEFVYQVHYGRGPEIIGPARGRQTLRGSIARPPLLPGYSFYQIAGEKVRIGVLSRAARRLPGAGAFDSGRRDTAERAEEILAEGFGED